jgi:AcrR family transcriptional regulator
MEPRLHILHRVRVVSDAPSEPVVPPLRRDAERNRRLILEHARQVVAVSGLGASHEQIAHAAGVGIGTVYRRFPRKSDLFVALFDDQLDRVVQLARAALEVPDPWTALTGFLEAILDLQAQDRGLKELLLGSSRALELSRRSQDQVAPVVAELLSRAQASGQVRGDITVQDLALVPIEVGAIIDSARGVEPQLWRRTLALVLDGLRARPDITALPVSSPSPEQFERVMAGWRPPSG